MIALTARIITVLLTAPALSEDLWRYIHDGQTLLAGENPYAEAPAADPAFNRSKNEMAGPFPHAVNNINHPELVTIYQPVSQYVFAGLALVHRHMHAWTGRDAMGLDVFRLGFVMFDMAVIALLLWQLHREARSPWWAALYAWHPLAISEVAWSGHQDVIGIALLVAALVVISSVLRGEARGDLRSRAKQGGMVSGGGALFALAVAVKPIVAPLLLPIGWHLMRRPWWRLPMMCAVIGVVLPALYLPFILMPGGLDGMIETVRTFMDKWAFNSSLHALAQHWSGEKVWADRLMAALLGAVLVVVTFARLDLWRAVGVYLLAAVLLSSTAHPWYVLWPLALCAVRFDWVTWVLSLTIVLSYESRLHPDTLKPAEWVPWLEYGPVYGMLLVVAAVALYQWQRRRRSDGTIHEEPSRVIPPRPGHSD